ncbi:hypothetical protein PT2222_200100 [Paraburkholderia tropica]
MIRLNGIHRPAGISWRCRRASESPSCAVRAVLPPLNLFDLACISGKRTRKFRGRPQKNCVAAHSSAQLARGSSLNVRALCSYRRRGNVCMTLTRVMRSQPDECAKKP